MSKPRANRLWLFITAAAATNFLYSLPYEYPAAYTDIPPFPLHNMLLRMLLLILAEWVVVTGFGRLTVASMRWMGGRRNLGVFIIAIVSAWTTMFNIQWLLLTHAPANFFDHAAFFLATVIVLALDTYFVFRRTERVDPDIQSLVVGAQALGYAVVYFVVALAPLIQLNPLSAGP